MLRRTSIGLRRATANHLYNAAEVLAKYKAHLEEFGDMAEPAKIEGASVMFAEVGGGDFDGACKSATSSPASRRSRAATRPSRP